MPETAVEPKKYQRWGDKPRRHKLRATAKFDFSFIPIAANLVAGGFTQEDLAFAFSVSFDTIKGWKKSFPQFKAACLAGKGALEPHLTAQMVRAATGYDYTKKIVTYRMETSGEGEAKTTKKVKTGEKIITDHQKGEPTLLMFALCNMWPEKWKQQQQLKIDETRNINFRIDGQADAKEICGLARAILAANTSEHRAKPVISTELSPDDNGRRIPADVSAITS